jgi:hypothetical protein
MLGCRRGTLSSSANRLALSGKDTGQAEDALTGLQNEKVEAMADESNHCVMVRAAGRELDSLREAASSTAREYGSDWYAERRAEGTAFCFENAHVKTLFEAHCAKYNIQHQVLRR